MSYNMTSPDYMLMLNTHLQRMRQAEYLVWEFYETGPQHQLTHTAIAKLNGYPIGRGEGLTRSIAKQRAAHQFLRSQGYPI
ncbi:hypothetical protein K488DRAFT_83321 [Vararia minispora EC-137]|uniref:Uncharacterized protein n=1 Tax=Vararia minispora EC-137 TaxID=1314806 RepID=A0ACB8QU90_9AGAM|nr:hypothetical protein K488DRAFT_83321 [Vararia minispora EC-137]